MTMACIEHNCAHCGWWKIDNEKLVVCPQCASNQITNHYTHEFDDDEVQESYDDE